MVRESQWNICHQHNLMMIHIHTQPCRYAYTYIYTMPIYIHTHTDILTPTCICINASKYVHQVREELIVLHKREVETSSIVKDQLCEITLTM